MDYVVHAAYKNISRTYFHQGTVGNCQYCFWGRHSMGTPYYGATAATAFLAKSSYLTELDNGKTPYAAYASYDANGAPVAALLYNSDYYSGTGTRSSQSFVLTGLTGSTLRAKRLTAPSAESRQDRSELPSFGGQSFVDGSCVSQGAETVETTTISGDQATFTLKASEALVVYFQ
jgi:Glycosyl hydrolase family 79 C-terminal beta domain